jgi:hypothetical protein
MNRHCGLASVCILIIALALPRASPAVFHLAVIDEIMTSYDGDPNVQFVEIRMLAGSQQLVSDTVLGAFDASGSFIGDVLIVPGDVANGGAGVRWVMGTAAFQAASGLAPDFSMSAGLPTGGGMVCWGAPGIFPPAPGSWDHTDPVKYVDCVAYGSYSGPSNVLVGGPTPLDADGHSLVRISETNDNLSDFACGDPAGPVNNLGGSAALAATTPCPSSAIPVLPAWGLGALMLLVLAGGAFALQRPWTRGVG